MTMSLCLIELEKLSVPFHLQKLLEKRIKIKTVYSESIFDYLNEKIENKINEYLNSDLANSDKISRSNMPNIRDINSLKEVSNESSLYFRQALEMFKASQNMNKNCKNSSPLVEYYGYLQCLKGIIATYLDTERTKFFSYHGLTTVKNNDSYCQAEIKPFGVFPAFLLIFGKQNRLIKEILSKDYKPTIEQLLLDPYFLEVKRPFEDPIKSIIVSWMLSSIVRYKPNIWEKICLGKEDDIKLQIREFRENTLPKCIFRIIDETINLNSYYGFQD